nr:MAG TPA: hypothetical protein [Bacteriophage sp.]
MIFHSGIKNSSGHIKLLLFKNLPVQKSVLLLCVLHIYVYNRISEISIIDGNVWINQRTFTHKKLLL